MSERCKAIYGPFKTLECIKRELTKTGHSNRFYVVNCDDGLHVCSVGETTLREFESFTKALKLEGARVYPILQVDEPEDANVRSSKIFYTCKT